MTNWRTLNEHDLNRSGINMVYESLPAEGVTNKIKATDILGQNTSYDILWNDNKLCVRVSNISNTSRFPKWSYTIKAINKHMVDFYVFIALKDNYVYKIFILPPDIIPETTVSISERLGNLRYSSFITSLEGIPAKIAGVKEKLPQYRKLYGEARI